MVFHACTKIGCAQYVDCWRLTEHFCFYILFGFLFAPVSFLKKFLGFFMAWCCWFVGRLWCQKENNERFARDESLADSSVKIWINWLIKMYSNFFVRMNEHAEERLIFCVHRELHESYLFVLACCACKCRIIESSLSFVTFLVCFFCLCCTYEYLYRCLYWISMAAVCLPLGRHE